MVIIKFRSNKFLDNIIFPYKIYTIYNKIYSYLLFLIPMTVLCCNQKYAVKTTGSAITLFFKLYIVNIVLSYNVYINSLCMSVYESLRFCDV